MTAVLLGIGVYAIFSYLGEETEEYVNVSRYLYLLLRVALSFIFVGLVMGWDEWYLGFAVVGVSRLCSRLDNYVTTLAVSISQQRRR
jgi:hypothetical protein